ncbi:hypothetical protein B0H11DRAFT_1904422 [Mycena galericulata]|nr:hypothetical protein B0H11DRAFT_1904422 [Mycena galericulata]
MSPSPPRIYPARRRNHHPKILPRARERMYMPTARKAGGVARAWRALRTRCHRAPLLRASGVDRARLRAMSGDAQREVALIPWTTVAGQAQRVLERMPRLPGAGCTCCTAGARYQRHRRDVAQRRASDKSTPVEWETAFDGEDLEVGGAKEYARDLRDAEPYAPLLTIVSHRYFHTSDGKSDMTWRICSHIWWDLPKSGSLFSGTIWRWRSRTKETWWREERNHAVTVTTNVHFRKVRRKSPGIL